MLSIATIWTHKCDIPPVLQTRGLMLERALPCILLALLYVYMLGIAAQSGVLEMVAAAMQPFSISMPAIGALFENNIITLLTWVHLITLDLWQAR